jgi:hypothetical protein
MKRIILFSASLIFMHGVAHADLPASAISTMNLSMFGMYTTSDPTCQKGLTATIPLSATSTTFNFAASPTLGSGPIASPINCVIFILKSGIIINYSAGTYTGTGTGGSPSSDSACFAGGSISQGICRSTTTNFPAQVVSDAAAVGLTLTTTCPGSPTGNEVIPVYISTYSACTGSTVLDAGNSTCVAIDAGVGPNTFQAPTAANDTAHGLILSSVASGGSAYKFVIGVSHSVGGNGGSCAAVSAPTFALTN